MKGNKMRKASVSRNSVPAVVGIYATVFYLLSSVDITVRALLSLVVTVTLYYLATHSCSSGPNSAHDT